MPVKLRPDLLECEKKALALLESKKIVDATIIRVAPGEILFTQPRDAKDKLKDAWTAWVNEAGTEILRLERGFVACYD